MLSRFFTILSVIGWILLAVFLVLLKVINAI